MVAARLSEDPHRHVTLFEHGPDLDAGSRPPGIDSANFLDASDVPGRVFPDLVATFRAGGPARRYRRGRGLGGSSSVNAMVTLHGDDALYRSWGWSDVDEAWARAVLPVSEPTDDELGSVDRALLAAAPDAIRAPLARQHGRRVTAVDTMLAPARERPNLSVLVDSPVERIVLHGRRAIGVRLADGTTHRGDHVVVCAGAIHSPALLLRSGIDVPGLGDGLQDHPAAPFTIALREPTDPSSLAIGSLLDRDPVQFLPMNHLGPSGSSYGLLMVALMRPRSRSGTVRLGPDGEPLVDFDLLSHPADRRALGAGVADAMELLRSDPFREIAEAVYVDAVGTPLDALADAAAIDRWLDTVVGDYVHATSTCAMGVVVDGDGAVVGHDGLTVCDASVFPSIPDVNTHGPTTMLAERLVARWRRR